MPNGNLPDRLRHPLSARRGAYPTPAETYLPSLVVLCRMGGMDGCDYATHARSLPGSRPFIMTVKERARMSSEAGVI
jgi:hypothetical protein